MKNPLGNPRSQLVIILLVLSVGGGYAWYNLRYQPTTADIQSLSAQWNKITNDNAERQRVLSQMGSDRIREALDKYRKQAATIGRLVPPDTARTPILPLITSAAVAENVRLENIKPLPADSMGSFLTEGFEVTASGRYHDMGAFVTTILSLDRLTQVSRFTLTPVDLNALGDIAGTVDSTGTLTAGTAGPPSVDLIDGPPRRDHLAPATEGRSSRSRAAAADAAPPHYGVRVTLQLVGFLVSTAPKPEPKKAPPAAPGPAGASSGTPTGGANGAAVAAKARGLDKGAPVVADTGDDIVIPARRKRPPGGTP